MPTLINKNYSWNNLLVLKFCQTGMDKSRTAEPDTGRSETRVKYLSGVYSRSAICPSRCTYRHMWIYSGLRSGRKYESKCRLWTLSKAASPGRIARTVNSFRTSNITPESTETIDSLLLFSHHLFKCMPLLFLGAQIFLVITTAVSVSGCQLNVINWQY